MIKYPERLNLAQTPTPFYPLERLSEQLGGPRIWIKRDDLTGAATSGNKIRKLEFLLAEALANGCDTLSPLAVCNPTTAAQWRCSALSWGLKCTYYYALILSPSQWVICS